MGIWRPISGKVGDLTSPPAHSVFREGGSQVEEFFRIYSNLYLSFCKHYTILLLLTLFFFFCFSLSIFFLLFILFTDVLF